VNAFPSEYIAVPHSCEDTFSNNPALEVALATPWAQESAPIKTRHCKGNEERERDKALF
jgi:hypothetical protein